MREKLQSKTAVACLLAFAGAAAPALPQREPPVPRELIERVGEWAEQTLAAKQSYAAEELLVQTTFGKRGRSTRQITSDYFRLFLAENPGAEVEARDTVNVDGEPRRSAAERDARFARVSAAQSLKDLAGVLDGPAGLRLAQEQFEGLWRMIGRLAPRHQGKMKYFFAPDTSDPPSRHTLIGYRQVQGEGLMLADGKAIPAAGLAWVDPDDGHIARIEEEFSVKNARYSTAVEFARPPELGTWVPSLITVRIFEKGRLALESQYSYSAFRRLRSEQVAGENANP